MGRQILSKYVKTFFAAIFSLLLTTSILAARPSLANPEIDEFVTLSNPQIHGNIIEEGTNATVQWATKK